jgi:hypothetical protein
MKMSIQTIVLLKSTGPIAGVLSDRNYAGNNNGSALLLMDFTQQQAQGTSLAALLPPVTCLQ